MSGYIGPIPVPQGIQNKETFTATAAQTTFNTNGYTDGTFISVYLNGVRLVNGTDYTATNGSDVVLASGANAGDVLDFETFNSFSLVDQTFDNVTLKNPTHEDTDGGRESAVSFKGEQSGGEISTLAQIQASHDGTADDQKGDLIFKTNDGSDNDAPTERLRLDSVGSLGLGTSIPVSSSAGVYLTGGGATYSTSSTYRYDMVNAYFDTSASAWKYIANGVATQIYQANGSLLFNYAANNSSGAGASLSWTERFKIDNDGHTFFTLGTNAMGAFSDGVGEVGSGNFCLQVSNTAASALKPLGFRAEDIRFATGSAERMRIDSGGNVGIGTTNPSAPFDVTKAGGGNYVAHFQNTTDATPYGVVIKDASSGANGYPLLQVTNAAGSVNHFRVNSGNGYIFSVGAYNNTTSNAANMYVFNSGDITRSTSSRRYKNTIQDSTVGLAELNTLRPVSFKGNNDGDAVFNGLIAEEVHDAGLTQFVEYDDEDRPDALRYPHMVSLCIKAIQELSAKVDALETENTAIKARLDALEAE